MSIEEREAIGRLQRGDIGGLEALVRLYYVPAVRAAYLITRERAQAEDVVQGAFLRAYERIGQFDGVRPFGPWFLRSVINAAVTASVRQQRHVSWEALTRERGYDPQLSPSDPDPSPDELLMSSETRHELWQALNCLSPEQRAAIVRRYYLDLSDTEVASDLNCSPGTVKWRLHAARRRLRSILRPL